jgi:hypothetical protein
MQGLLRDGGVLSGTCAEAKALPEIARKYRGCGSSPASGRTRVAAGLTACRVIRNEVRDLSTTVDQGSLASLGMTPI